MPWLRLRLQLCSRVVSGLEAPRPLYFSCFCMEFTSHSWSQSKCVVNNNTHHTTPHHTTPHHTPHTTHHTPHTTHHTPPPSVLLRVTWQVALTGNFSGRCERTRWSRHEAAATTALAVATRATTIKQQANKNQTRIEQETNKKPRRNKREANNKPTKQHKQTHKHTNKQTHTHTHKQANNTNKQTNKQTDR